jgi:hypothetical protein
MVSILLLLKFQGGLTNVKLQYYQTVGTGVPGMQNTPALLLLQLPG